MNHRSKWSVLLAVGFIVLMGRHEALQQQNDATVPPRVLGALTVRTVAGGLERPWSLAFLPDGNMLVTERVGRMRVIRNGVLDPTPIPGMPGVNAVSVSGLMDVVLHPRFAENGFVYFSYSKPGVLPPGVEPNGPRLEIPNFLTVDRITGRVNRPVRPQGKTSRATLARGRWTGTTLVDIKDIFIADDIQDDSMLSTTAAAPLVFGRDDMLYMGVGGAQAPATSGPFARATGGRAQDPNSHGGKVLRLRDDGMAPPDNPFVGRSGYKPEIYTMGHRNSLGMTVHPETGAIWMTENGPLDGDEVNVLKPGANYGWPIVGMGRDYLGDFIGGKGSLGSSVGRDDAHTMYMPGMEQPWIFWTPTDAPSGLTFYTGDKFPRWQGSLFVGTLEGKRLEREVFNYKGWPVFREYYLEELNQRIRKVYQGPDGFLYVLTDENPGAVLRIEPTP